MLTIKKKLNLITKKKNSSGGSVTLESFHDNKGHCIVIKKNTKIMPPFSADCVQAVVFPNKTAGPMATEAVKYARQLVNQFIHNKFFFK